MDRIGSALHLHAGRLHRLRGDLPCAGDPAHPADVGLELRARRGAGRRHGGTRHADPEDPLQLAIGFVAVVLGAANAAGGYVVTERMLAMFKGKKNARERTT
jgi:hypothetical protein